jgi:hypothetical protein
MPKKSEMSANKNPKMATPSKAIDAEQENWCQLVCFYGQGMKW